MIGVLHTARNNAIEFIVSSEKLLTNFSYPPARVLLINWPSHIIVLLWNFSVEFISMLFSFFFLFVLEGRW